MRKTVLTVAAGKQLYTGYATNLAMSFLYWHPDSEIDFKLITDRPQDIPESVREKIKVISVDASTIGEGFSSKLVLDQYFDEGQNLFIDADCMVYASLEAVFKRFEGHTATVIGHTIYEGHDIGFTKDVKKLINSLGLPYYPIFCGSVYYFEKNSVIPEFFEYTKSLLPRYDEIGLVRLRNKENEEPLIALAMAKFQQMPLADDGSIKSDRMHFDHCDKNVLTGRRKLWVNESPPKPFSSTLLEASPVIIHYNARFADGYEYKTDVLRLKLFYSGYNKKLVNSLVSFFYELPLSSCMFLEEKAKDLFRPAFRALAGTRKIKKSNRL